MIIATKLLKSNDPVYAKMDLRVIGANGEQLGIMPFADAINAARNAGLDLVLMSENATPPVCKIQDFKKTLYEQKKKQKEQQKKSKAQEQKTKEVKFGLNIGEHDYERKIDDAKEFFQEGDKVKVTVTLRGREKQHPEAAEELMNRVIASLEGFGTPTGKLDANGATKGFGYQLVFNPCK